MGSGKFRIVAVDLPPELVEAFYFFENLDQIGPAYFAEIQTLEDLLLVLSEVVP